MLLAAIARTAHKCDSPAEQRETRPKAAHSALEQLPQPPPVAAAVAVSGAVYRGEGVLAIRGLPVRIRKDGEACCRTRTDEWGRFVFRDAPPSPFEVEVEPIASFGQGPPPRLPGFRGQRDLVIRLAPESTLVLQREAAGGVLSAVDVHAASTKGRSDVIGAWRRGDAAGVIVGARFGQRYDLLVRDVVNDRAYFGGGLRIFGVVTVEMKPAEPVVGRLDLPRGARLEVVHGVLACRGIRVPVRALGQGAFSFPAFPREAEWVLSFELWQGDDRLVADLDVVPGKPAEIRFPAR